MIIPEPWREYARLQHHLSNSTVVGEQTIGIESGLHAIVEGIAHGVPLSRDDVDRSVKTARRRERYRAARRYPLAAQAAVNTEPDPEYAACVADDIRRARSQAADADWVLLWGLAEGYSYAELAKPRGCTEGALRIKVKRIRDGVAHRVQLANSDRAGVGRAA